MASRSLNRTIQSGPVSFVSRSTILGSSMNDNVAFQENELRAKAAAGDLSACDSLATYLYTRQRYEEAASLYLKAVQGDFYKTNHNEISERNFFGMVDHNLIAHTSEAARYVRERRNLSVEVTGRAHRAAGRAGIATFIGYMLLVYAGGVTGFLRKRRLGQIEINVSEGGNQ